MSQSLSASKLPETILPGVGTALAFMGGMAVVGGIAGAAIFSRRQSSAWLYGGIGAGVTIGGTIGYFGGRLIVHRTIAKIEASGAKGDA